MRAHRAALLLAFAALVAFVVVATASHRPRRHNATRAFSGHLTYRETTPEASTGSPKRALSGTGTFAIRLGALGREAALLSESLTEVPVDHFPGRGSLQTRYRAEPGGAVSGVAVLTFSTPGAGSVCISYHVNGGAFVAGQSGTPPTASFRTVGGTGAGARLRFSGTVKETDLVGESVERLFGAGLLHGGVGTATAPSAACRAVAQAS